MTNKYMIKVIDSITNEIIGICYVLSGNASFKCLNSLNSVSIYTKQTIKVYHIIDFEYINASSLNLYVMYSNDKEY